MRPLLPVILSCLAAVAVAAEPVTFTGTAVSVHDGDTLHVLDDAKREHTIRPASIEATRQFLSECPFYVLRSMRAVSG